MSDKLNSVAREKKTVPKQVYMFYAGYLVHLFSDCVIQEMFFPALNRGKSGEVPWVTSSCMSKKFTFERSRRNGRRPLAKTGTI